MEDKYRLEIIGITYNQIESGVYALILQQKGTNRRIPIIIGFPEAQAIECKLQEIKTPRPLTHDIMMTSLNDFGIQLEYVIIKRLPNGVFAADLHLSDGITTKVVDARSSDAVALAIRSNAPIYTTEDVIRDASFDPSEKRGKTVAGRQPMKVVIKNSSESEKGLDSKTIDELNQAMARAVEMEDYEEAARIKVEIEKRSQSSKPEDTDKEK